MRLQFISDLHLEIERGAGEEDDGALYAFDFPVTGDALALLGDIGTTQYPRLFDWLRAQLQRFATVFYVAGNHEPYWSSLDESRQKLEEFAAENQGRFVLLDRTRYDVSATVTILGCTLWSRLAEDDLDILSWAMTDFKRIASFTPESYQALHTADVAWLQAEIARLQQEEPQRRIVVLTHHAPTFDGTSDPKYVGGPTNSGFATELVGGACWAPNVQVWVFGHTHWNLDAVRAGVRVVSNQRGYRDGAPGFDPRKVVDLAAL
ncbi:Ser/Thr protein phosphatase superfamily protein [Auricularia subglabra TFB-10046 SS5]|nr:Ser/Thr protein phosphatase superfamily protein [Auricularia subglabra TFB-10046 SS5]